MSPLGEPSIARALRDLARALAARKEPSMLIGGIASILRGVPRTTLDIDVVMWAEGIDLPELVDDLGSYGFVPRVRNATDLARTHQVLLLRHSDTRTPIDLVLAWLPFERDALERATWEAIGPARIRAATPSDLVVLKSVAGRPKDWSDIEVLLSKHGRTMKLRRIRQLVSEFAAVIEAPDRLVELDARIASARSQPSASRSRGRKSKRPSSPRLRKKSKRGPRSR